MSRKPKVNLEKLKNVGRGPLFSMKAGFEDFETLLRDGQLTTPFVAFEALGSIVGAYLEGFTYEEIRRTFPPSWGDESVTIPLPLLLALRDAWSDYIVAYSGQSMEEAFQIHAKGGGKRPQKTRLESLRKERHTANKVEIEYLCSDKSLNVIYQQVAIELGSTFETVKDHHKKHRDKIRDELKSLGILEG